MSADPVTMMIIQGSVQAIGTYSEIQESKRQSSIEQQKYELKMKEANLQGLTEENNRLEEAEKTKKHNLAILSGSGWSDDSKSFININNQVDIAAQKDITTIRLNTGSKVNELSLSAQAAKSGRKSDQFGGWMSIVGTGLETKARTDSYSSKSKKNTSKDTSDWRFNKR